MRFSRTLSDRFYSLLFHLWFYSFDFRRNGGFRWSRKLVEDLLWIKKDDKGWSFYFRLWEKIRRFIEQSRWSSYLSHLLVIVSINQSINQSNHQSINQPIIKSINQSIRPSINQTYHLDNQWINQSFRTSIRQSIHLKIQQLPINPHFHQIASALSSSSGLASRAWLVFGILAFSLSNIRSKNQETLSPFARNQSSPVWPTSSKLGPTRSSNSIRRWKVGKDGGMDGSVRRKIYDRRRRKKTWVLRKLNSSLQDS